VLQDECLTAFYLCPTQHILPFTQLVFKLVVCSDALLLPVQSPLPCAMAPRHDLRRRSGGGAGKGGAGQHRPGEGCWRWGLPPAGGPAGGFAVGNVVGKGGRERGEGRGGGGVPGAAAVGAALHGGVVHASVEDELLLARDLRRAAVVGLRGRFHAVLPL
jgi:hypothetical protein